MILRFDGNLCKKKTFRTMFSYQNQIKALIRQKQMINKCIKVEGMKFKNTYIYILLLAHMYIYMKVKCV